MAPHAMPFSGKLTPLLGFSAPHEQAAASAPAAAQGAVATAAEMSAGHSSGSATHSEQEPSLDEHAGSSAPPRYTVAAHGRLVPGSSSNLAPISAPVAASKYHVTAPPSGLNTT